MRLTEGARRTLLTFCIRLQSEAYRQYAEVKLIRTMQPPDCSVSTRTSSLRSDRTCKRRTANDRSKGSSSLHLRILGESEIAIHVAGIARRDDKLPFCLARTEGEKFPALVPVQVKLDVNHLLCGLLLQVHYYRFKY